MSSVRFLSGPRWALEIACQRPAAWVWGRLCYCAHCHGLGCGGWCRWCP